MRGILHGLIRIYQLFSRLLPRRCKFHPTCSQYMYDAVGVHGVPRGLWLGARRIGRCHPWSLGGVDYVPQRHVEGGPRVEGGAAYTSPLADV